MTLSVFLMLYRLPTINFFSTGRTIGPDIWDIQSLIVSVTSDSAAVMVRAAEIAGIPHVACFAHCLHNSVKKALEEGQHLNDLIEKCHDLAKFFHHSPKMAAALYRHQDELDSPLDSVMVVMDVVTRWNSTLLMIWRLVRLRNPIVLFFDEVQDKDKHVKEKLKPLMLSGAEWGIIEELVKVLELAEKMTLIFSSASKGLAASLYPWVVMIQDELNMMELKSETADVFQRDLKQQLQE